MSIKPFKIYNASAGAGKTYTLVFEFLAILLQKAEPDAFRELLAITFTNKAANEMKERIISQLQNLAENQVSDIELEQYRKRTGLDNSKIQAKAEAILTAILHNYALFSVSTIDKFNLRLMRAFSQDMGLSMNFDVEMNVMDVLKESVDVLFSELEVDDTMSNLLSNIAIENLDDDKHWDISKDIAERAGALFQDKFLTELKVLEEIPLDKLIEFREKARKNYFGSKKIMQTHAQEFVDYCLRNSLSYSDFKYKNTGLLSYYQKILNGVAEPYGKRHQTIIDTGTILAIKDHPLNDELLSLASEKYEAILDQVINYNFWQKIYKNINPVTTLNEIDKKLEAIKAESNILLISEFNKIISENIKDQPTPFIYEKIGNRYKNYFIDEFQDTSDLQWDNLKPLVENAIATNNSVMIVGDPKQSIYRFRGGNPDLMIGLSNQKEEWMETIDLPKNWRSHENVIQFNNLLYTQIAHLLNNQSYAELYKDGNQQLSNAKKGGYVQIDYLETPASGQGLQFIEDVAVPKLIENIRQCIANGFSYGEMAILVRQKSEGRKIAESLAKESIEVISNESLALNNSSDVQLLLSFIRFLSDKENPSYRADLLISLGSHNLLDVEDESRAYSELLSKNATDFLIQLEEYGVKLSFVRLPFKTLYDHVSSAIRAFGLNVKGGSYITFFMDEVLKFQQKKEVTAIAFMEFWNLKGADTSISLPDGNDAIQLMTIHKSKGLEFPVVFLPLANWTSQSNGVWISTGDNDIPRLYIDKIKSTDILPEPIKNRISQEESQSELDSLNMLYVATTRAVEQLYIGTQKVKKDSSKLLLNYFDHLSSHFEVDTEGSIKFGLKERVSHSELIENSNLVVPYISSEWTEKIRVSKEHALLWDESRIASLNYGNKMHAILEKLVHVEEMDELLNKFEIEGYISKEERQAITCELNKLFKEPELERIFNATTFINERDFISSEGKIFRPDRMVKMDEKWTVIDYKTGEPLQNHQNQIKHYAEDLLDLGYAVDKALLIYLGSQSPIVHVL